jgi:hypothetical protein
MRSDEIRNRIEIQEGELVLLGVDVRKEHEVIYQRIGLSCPYVKAGPLKLKGLLRELFNPLGYGPGSSVFRERPEIRLERSFSGSNKTGIVFDPIPEYVECFLFESNKVAKAGGTLLIPVGDYMETQLLVSTSEPQREEADESWFNESRLFPGDRLMHGAARLVLDHPGLFGSLSYCVSWGRQISPGYFTLLDITMKTDVFRPELCMGISSPGYFSPDGGWCSRGISCGLDITLVPLSFLQIEGGYLCRLDHLSGWESAMSRFLSSLEKIRSLSGSESYSVEAEGNWCPRDDVTITVSPRFEANVERKGNGKTTRTDTYTVQSRLSLLKLELLAAYRREDDVNQLELGIRYALLPGRLEVSSSINQIVHCPYGSALDFELDLMSEIHHLFVRFEYEQNVTLFSLGLETELGW